LAAPADRLPFNVVCHGPQKFGWTELDLPAIKTVKERCGGTVNDVILTVVAAALRRYSELRKVRVKGRSARIMIPVNVRGGDNAGELGNRISFVPVTVPLDIRDPQKLFAFVRERTEYLKRVHAAELVGFAGGLFSTIPSPIWAAIGPVASQLPLSLCNIICTNVPGPQMPLYLLGHKMLSWYPYVPIGGEMGTNWAILSYNGKAYFGFSCDVGAVPDPENLERFVEESFAELCASAERVRPQKLERDGARLTMAEDRRRERSRRIQRGRPTRAKLTPRVKKLKSKANGAAKFTNSTARNKGKSSPGPIPPKAAAEAVAGSAAAEPAYQDLALAVGA
jgi:diacylglycerol O-acyltransferase